MPQIEELVIFLASPGDVGPERDRARAAVEELNRTLCPSLGVRLRMVGWETDALPGFGTDPQALVNAQLGNMSDYALFVGVFWNRLGTPTPRAGSGTVEEFERAAAMNAAERRPEIWLYFSTAPANLDTRERLAQKQGVLELKEHLQSKALLVNYSGPADFEQRFRQDLTRWLQHNFGRGYAAEVVRETAPRAFKSTTEPSRDLAAPRSRGTPPESGAVVGGTVVSSSGSLVLLGQAFFNAENVRHRHDETIEIVIVPVDAEETTLLRGLRRDPYQGPQQVAFAYQDEARAARVESVESESRDGRTAFTVILSSAPPERNRFLEDASINNYSADEVAEIRAHLILLGKPPADVPRRHLDFLRSFLGVDVKTDRGALFLRLARDLDPNDPRFLQCARLLAIYTLITTGTVEHVLELQLRPVKGSVLQVAFRGQRRERYSGERPARIEVRGESPLTGQS